MAPHARLRKEQAERLPIRVHDIIIRGNSRTKDAVIESEVEELLRGATTFQELRHAAALAEERLRALDIFESVDVRVDACPPELPGTANVVVEVSEPSNQFAENLRSFAKSAGDIWDASVGYGLGEFLSFRIPLSGRMPLIASLPLTVGILSCGNHDPSHKLTWSSRPDPFQPGYSLVSVLRYSFKIDHRDSRLRPTKGFAFLSNTRIGGPEPSSLRFIRQEVALRYAIPLGFYGAALNLGASAGVEVSSWVHPFRGRAPDPAELRKVFRDNLNNDKNFDNVRVGLSLWDLPLGALADLSFDLPLKVLRDAGIYGHVSAKANCLFREFTLQRLMDTLQCNVGVGVIIPTRLFRVEVNYYRIIGHGVRNPEKTGICFKVSSRC